MIKYSRWLLLVSILILFSGCKRENYSYAYLLQHPAELESEYNRCQALPKKEAAQDNQCRIVTNAVNTITDIIRQQRNDPEKFGLRILVAEMTLQENGKKLEDAQKTLENLKQTNAPADKIQVAQAEVNQRLLDYNIKQEEIKMLLGIMGINTPE